MPLYHDTQPIPIPRSLSISDIQDLLNTDIDEPPLLINTPIEFHPFYSPCSLSLDLSPTDSSSSPTSPYDDTVSTLLDGNMTTETYNNTIPPSDYFLKYFYKSSVVPDIKKESLHIQVLGVPSIGAKSRVETQIRLCLQLIAEDGTKVMDWSYIKIKEEMLARSRLRRNSQYKPIDDINMALASNRLEGVLHLEAKVVCSSNTGHPIRMCIGCVRRERKRAERTKDGKSKHEVIYHPQNIETERDRILLFNCNSIVKFNSGDILLPTRITCYCRHHNEKEGFKICFILKDSQGEVVATGISPPVMITDDHKSTKQKSSNRKRVREDEKPDTPAPSRPGSVHTGDDDTVTDIPVLDMNLTDRLKQKTTPTNRMQRKKHRNRADQKQEPVISTEIKAEKEVLSVDNDAQHSPESIDQMTTSAMDDTWPFNRRRKIDKDYYIPNDGLLSILDNYTLSMAPQLERIVPAQGPTYGGIEVTILGNGFYQGLTCLFGEHPANTAYWNSSTLVCILPPAAQTGPVVVSFKEHPVVLERNDVAIFTYYDASDQALLELALQVVGLKMTGKLHDAKQVAMRIVQGDQQNNPHMAPEHNICMMNGSGHTLLHLATILNYDEIVKALVAYPIHEGADFINMKDKNGMTALHFACLLGHVDIVKILLKTGADPSAQSHKMDTPGSLNEKDTIISELLDSYVHLRKKSLSRRPSVKCHMTHRFHTLISKEPDTGVSSNKAPSMETDGLGLVHQKLDRRLYLFWLPVLIVAIGLLCIQFIGHPFIIFDSLLERKIPDHTAYRVVSHE